jgi:hypothetical protein
MTFKHGQYRLNAMEEMQLILRIRFEYEQMTTKRRTNAALSSEIVRESPRSSTGATGSLILENVKIT